MLALCWPKLALCCPKLPLSCPKLPLSCPHVGPMFTYVGLGNALPHSSDRKGGGGEEVGRRWGGGGEGVGMFPVFSLLGNPLIDMDLRNACTCIESTLLYSCTFPQTCVF